MISIRYYYEMQSSCRRIISYFGLPRTLLYKKLRWFLLRSLHVEPLIRFFEEHHAHVLWISLFSLFLFLGLSLHYCIIVLVEEQSDFFGLSFTNIAADSMTVSLLDEILRSVSQCRPQPRALICHAPPWFHFAYATPVPHYHFILFSMSAAAFTTWLIFTLPWRHFHSHTRKFTPICLIFFISYV